VDLSLHPQQTKAFLSEATEILYGGAAGGGKSHLMRVASIAWCADIPGLQVYIFRRLSEDLAKNHMNGPTGFPVLLKDWVDSGHAKINYSKNYIEFWNGSKIFLCHVQYEKNKYSYQGAEIHVLIIDELTHFTESIYRYLRGRMRMGALKVPQQYQGRFPRVICGSNPGGVGHNWVKAAFIDPARPMEIVEQSKKEGGMKRQYIPAKLDDNPTLAETDPDYLDRLEGLGDPALIKAMRDGDWDVVAGGIFDDVWSKDHQVLAPFEVPHSWRIDRGFDWGSSKPYAVLWFAESDGTTARMADGTTRTFPRGSVFIVSEMYGWNGKPNEGCRELATEVARKVRKLDVDMKRLVHPGPADSAIYDTQNGMCIADDMAKAPYFIRWTKADKSPGSRKNGWELMRKMLKQAKGNELPGLYIFDTCRHVIRTVPVLPRNLDKDGDLDTEAEDHIADVIRYRCSTKRKIMSVQGLPI
jgi:hypothetical protein